MNVLICVLAVVVPIYAGGGVDRILCTVRAECFVYWLWFCRVLDILVGCDTSSN